LCARGGPRISPKPPTDTGGWLTGGIDILTSGTIRRVLDLCAPRRIHPLTALPVILLGFLQTARSGPLAPPPGARVLTLNTHPGYFTEPGVVINPQNPHQVVVAFQDNAHIAYSNDSGLHWQIARDVAPKDYHVSGDVSVTYDNKGHAFICYIAFDSLGTTNYWAHGATRNGIYVRRSLDGGKTWEARAPAVVAHKTAPGIPFEDKPYIVADDSHGPNAGNLYVGWTRWTLTDSEILFSRSSDDGLTWSIPIEIDQRPGLPRDDNGANEGFMATVGPHGTLYAVWCDADGIVFTTSKDGGRSFAPARYIVPTAPTMFHIQAVSRANGFPQIGIDPRSGRLFVTWSDYRNGEVDVFDSISSDHGRSWSPALKVNTDPAHDGDDHFFQWLAIDPSTGDVYVLFYDRRNDPLDRSQTVTLARSSDGGRTFANYAWTNKLFDAGGSFLGDYTGLAALDGRVYGVWTEKPSGFPHIPRPGSLRHPDLSQLLRRRASVICVGIADFGAPGAGGK
jgi:hypothetical protein